MGNHERQPCDGSAVAEGGRETAPSQEIATFFRQAPRNGCLVADAVGIKNSTGGEFHIAANGRLRQRRADKQEKREMERAARGLGGRPSGPPLNSPAPPNSRLET